MKQFVTVELDSSSRSTRSLSSGVEKSLHHAVDSPGTPRWE